MAARSAMRTLVTVANGSLGTLHDGLDDVQVAIAAVHDELRATYFPPPPPEEPTVIDVRDDGFVPGDGGSDRVVVGDDDGGRPGSAGWVAMAGTSRRGEVTPRARDSGSTASATRHPAGRFDLAAGGDGAWRPGWDHVMGSLLGLGPDELERRQRAADRLMAAEAAAPSSTPMWPPR